ncbi:hypothetical protein P9112_012052 [Eukaryota sp. TZLM1-RC]
MNNETQVLDDLVSHTTVLNSEINEIDTDINKLQWLTKKYGPLFKKPLDFLHCLKEDRLSHISRIEDSFHNFHQSLHTAGRLASQLTQPQHFSTFEDPPSGNTQAFRSPVSIPVKSPSSGKLIFTNSSILCNSPHNAGPGRVSKNSTPSNTLYSPILAYRSP